jgi:two-component system, NarL family, nitrate/nitrite response regulator NarL
VSEPGQSATVEVSRTPARDQDRLGDLVSTILAITEFCADAEPTDRTDEQIVFDIDFDGDRYVLIRMPHVERKIPPLSPREQEIVRMVAQGHQNKVIAVVLNISSWTVCTHLRRIFAKLGVSSRAAMVARLAEFGGVFEAKANTGDRIFPRRPRAGTATSELGPPRRR